jgi:TetR/AcrR family transcriptional regulator
MNDPLSQRRAPGRPRQDAPGADVRDSLLDAATELFAQRGHESVALREIGAAAGVTPAMVAYYFGDKRGLLQAVFERMFDDLLAEVTQVLATVSDESVLSRLSRAQVSTIASAPWLPRFVLREVLSPDSPMRDLFVERFVSRAAAIIPQQLQREIDGGRIRNDVDPTLLVLSMIGMAIFPFLGHPVMGEALGYELGDEFTERLIAHNGLLLNRGCAPGGKAT